MNKLMSLLALFRQGSAVANPKMWKERQITATVLAGAILALINVLAVFGVSVPIDVGTANAIAAGLIAVVNVVLTVTTSNTVGLPSKQADLPVITPEALLVVPIVTEEQNGQIKLQEQYDKYKAFQAKVNE